jgi:hypothetical protein
MSNIGVHETAFGIFIISMFKHFYTAASRRQMAACFKPPCGGRRLGGDGRSFFTFLGIESVERIYLDTKVCGNTPDELASSCGFEGDSRTELFGVVLLRLVTGILVGIVWRGGRSTGEGWGMSILGVQGCWYLSGHVLWWGMVAVVEWRHVILGGGNVEEHLQILNGFWLSGEGLSTSHSVKTWPL